jgi:hypothetical protein
VDPVVQHVIEEVPADHALAHQAAEPVGEHREHGVHLVLLDQRLESLGIGPIFRHASSS